MDETTTVKKKPGPKKKRAEEVNPFAQPFEDMPAKLAETGNYTQKLKRNLQLWARKNLVDPKNKRQCDWDFAFFFWENLGSQQNWLPLRLSMITEFNPGAWNPDKFRRDFNCVVAEKEGAIVWRGRPDCPAEEYVICYRTLEQTRKVEEKQRQTSRKKMQERGEPGVEGLANAELKTDEKHQRVSAEVAR
jgi:hypothetical protein